MRNRLIFAMTLAVVFGTVSCNKEEYGAPDKSKYVYDIPQTDLGRDVITGAYYTNYTSAVSNKTPEEPILGLYKTSDAGVMSQHVAWADEAALDFFVFSWNGSAEDDNLIALFNSSRTAESNVKYVLRYDTGHLKITNEEPLQSEAKYKALLADFVDVLADYMQSETYYSIDGRPVMVITPANLSSSALLSVDFSKVIPRLKSDLKRFYAMDPYIIGEMGTGWVAPVNYADHQVYSFDGMCLKEWKTRSYDLFYSFFSFMDLNWNNWKTTLQKRDVDFIPCCYPSYNDRVSTANSYYYTFSEDGNVDDYVNFCNVAKRNIGSHDIVLINSWNEWKNGTNLEPSLLKETKFLEETKAQFKK